MAKFCALSNLRLNGSLVISQATEDVRVTTLNLASEPLLRKSGRILLVMLDARGSSIAWLLRLAAFVLFISGGALAQRYLTAPNVIRALPLEHHQKEQPSAVIFEATRKLEFAALLADSAPSVITPFTAQLEDASFEPRAEIVRGVAWLGPAFDALAPPVSA